MAVDSAVGYYSLGIQSAKETAATAYATTLATISGGGPRYDERQAIIEHPGALGSIPGDIKAAIPRTGYLVPNGATFLLRPRFIAKAFRTFCQVSTVNNTTHYTHTFVPSTNAQLVWASVLAAFVGDTTFVRRFLDGRMASLSVDAQTDQIQCALQLTNLSEGAPTGSETPVAEAADEMSPYSGSITWSVAGTSITHPITGAQTQFTQGLEEDRRVLFSTVRPSLNRRNIGANGTISGIDMDLGTYNLYKLINYGSTGATAPVNTPPTGPLTLVFQSLANITGAAVPFSLSMAFAKVQWAMETPNNQDDQFVRANPTWRLVWDTNPAFTVTVVNDQAAP